MTFGNNLQTLRESQGLSQKELANLVGVSTGIVAEWEADEAVPGLAELSRLCKALNVSADFLLHETTVEATNQVEMPPKDNARVVPVKKRPGLGWVIGIAVLCIVVALVAILWPRESVTPEPLLFSEDSTQIALADASVVTIFCFDHEGELTATGSGFVAFDGKTIITNYHVMTSAYTCKISTNQDVSYEASKILCYSKEQDIAILELAKDTGLQPLTLGDSSIIKKGETVVAIGSPLGIKNTVSTGVLSGRLMDTNMDVLQFTAPISSGSSGGALFDNSGNVIGITFASIVDGQNLNLAIPIELAVKLYDNKGTAKSVSAIHIEEYPHVAFLEKNKNIPEVTLSDLKANPEKYDGKIVKLITYISSYEPNKEDWNKSDLFVSEKSDISFDFWDDFNSCAGKDFEDYSGMVCILRECVRPTVSIKAGDKVVIIAKFDYSKGVRVENPTSWRDYLGYYNEVDFVVKYIYFE